MLRTGFRRWAIRGRNSSRPHCSNCPKINPGRAYSETCSHLVRFWEAKRKQIKPKGVSQ